MGGCFLLVRGWFLVAGQLMDSKQKRYYVDSETGEAYDFVAVPRSQSRGSNKGRFFMGMLDAFDDIANADWPDGDYKVFVKLLGRLDFEKLSSPRCENPS